MPASRNLPVKKTYCALALLFLFAGPRLQAQPASEAREGAWAFMPAQTLFEPLVGDPREPSIGLNAYLSDMGYEDSVGASVDFLHWRSSRDTQWAFGMSAGLWTLTRNPDLSVLWADDLYTGLYASGKSGPFSFRLEFLDQKSNLGDALFYSRSAILYTLNYEKLTASLWALPGLRLYAGGGYPSYWQHIDPAESEILLLAGLEAHSDPFRFLGPCGAYGTYHFQYQGQAGGTFNHEFQAGLQWRQEPRQGWSVRLAMVYYLGHSEFGQFYPQYDQHLGIGLYFDP